MASQRIGGLWQGNGVNLATLDDRLLYKGAAGLTTSSTQRRFPCSAWVGQGQLGAC